jgi:hypothetical protein
MCIVDMWMWQSASAAAREAYPHLYTDSYKAQVRSSGREAIFMSYVT